MLTFVSFIIVMIGSLNWFFIAAFQYDFVAGFFGTQASLLSRLVYFIIGMASFVLIAMVLKNKGKLKITENSFKQKFKKSESNKKDKSEDDGKNKDENEKYEIEKSQSDKTNIKNENRFKSNQNLENSKSENSSADNFSENAENSNISEQNSNAVPYGYKDFDVTQYDD